LSKKVGNKQYRQRLVELVREATGQYPEPINEDWLKRLMGGLQREDPKLAAAVMKAAKKKSKELNDKTI